MLIVRRQGNMAHVQQRLTLLLITRRDTASSSRRTLRGSQLLALGYQARRRKGERARHRHVDVAMTLVYGVNSIEIN